MASSLRSSPLEEDIALLVEDKVEHSRLKAELRSKIYDSDSLLRLAHRSYAESLNVLEQLETWEDEISGAHTDACKRVA